MVTQDFYLNAGQTQIGGWILWASLKFLCGLLGWNRNFYVGFGGRPKSVVTIVLITIYMGTPLTLSTLVLLVHGTLCDKSIPTPSHSLTLRESAKA